jgi:uncharacterized heparinase superfamily protein
MNMTGIQGYDRQGEKQKVLKKRVISWVQHTHSILQVLEDPFYNIIPTKRIF